MITEAILLEITVQPRRPFTPTKVIDIGAICIFLSVITSTFGRISHSFRDIGCI